MLQLLLLLLLALGVNLQSTAPSLNGQVDGNYYGINDTVYVASSNDMLPQNLKSNFLFDDQGNLVVKTTSMQKLDFVMVYQNLSEPIFEWCRSSAYEKCKDELFICIDQSCSDASKFSFFFKDSLPRFEHDGKVKIHGECVQVFSSGYKVDEGQMFSFLSGVQINSRSFPQNDSFTQTYVRLQGSTCGAILHFPNVFLAFTELVAASSTSTAATERFTNTSDNVSNDTVSSTKTTPETATWKLLGIIGGSILGVVLILGLIALILYFCLRKKTNKKRASKAGMKIAKLRATKSMESVATAVPGSPPKLQTPAPKPAKTVQPPIKSSVPKAAKTQPSKVKPSQPVLKPDATQSSGSTSTGIERTVQNGFLEPKEFSDDPTKTAEERTKEPSEELSLIQTAFPRMDVDATVPCSKLFEADFKVDYEYPVPVYRPPKITPFLMKKIVDKSVKESLYTPDCLVQQALRLPLVEDRAAMLLQAAIQANNQLYDLGFRRKTLRRSADMPLEYYVTAPAKSEKWLKDLKEGSFLRFMVASAAKEIVGKMGEYEDDTMIWKLHADKSSVTECLRQACLFGQPMKRRKFFTLAIYYQLANLIKRLPDEKALDCFEFPVSLLMDIFREAPHYFAIVETST